MMKPNLSPLTPPRPPKKDEGSLIGGFVVGFVAMALGTFAALYFLGGLLEMSAGTVGKAKAFVVISVPVFFVGQRALARGNAGLVGEARGLFFGLVCGAGAGMVLSAAIGMKGTGL